MERYFDYNATTPLADEVVQFMFEQARYFGNPSSVYKLGRQSKALIEKSRMNVAKLLGTTGYHVIFTSGGSESNNMIIKGFLHKYYDNPGHMITTCIEHPSILELCKYLEQDFGFDVTYLPVDHQGLVRIEDFKQAIRAETQLATIMYANNELGTIQPIQELAKVARANKIFFHTDAIQAVGKIPVNVEELGVDALSFSAHKFYGPKGIGGLYIKEKDCLEPLIQGGGQEGGLRGGTENLLSILGMGQAAKLVNELDQQTKKLLQLKTFFINSVTESIPHCKINGTIDALLSLPNTINLCFSNIHSGLLASQLNERYDISVSVGSACSSNRGSKHSHVLEAIGLSPAEIQSSVRISFGRYTQEQEVKFLVSALKATHDHSELVQLC